MSKRKSLIALVSALTLPLIATASVSAEEVVCSITNTGPNSTNTCTTNTGYKCKVENNTVVIVDNNNQQVAQSGNATTSGNTSGGSATSGSATNSNGTTFDFTLTNDSCVVKSVTQPTTPTPTTPSVGGLGAAGGGGAGAVAAVTSTPRPTVLANTSGESAAGIVAALIATLTTAVAGMRGLVLLQNRK